MRLFVLQETNYLKSVLLLHEKGSETSREVRWIKDGNERSQYDRTGRASYLIVYKWKWAVIKPEADDFRTWYPTVIRRGREKS